jgi:hypothetical protein
MPAATFRAVASPGYARKTRTMKCTVTGGLLQPCLFDWNEGRLCPGLDEQDLTAQRNALFAPGVEKSQIYVDHGLTGANRVRPGLSEAMAACRRYVCGDQAGPFYKLASHPT